MAKTNEFVEYVNELFEPFGPVSIKSMFGGYGIFRDDLMFGLIADSTLYLKVDEGNLPDYEALHLNPFEYNSKNRKTVAMSYYRIPDSCMDNSRELLPWARKAWEAARRAQAKKPKSGLTQVVRKKKRIARKTAKKKTLKSSKKQASKKKAGKIVKRKTRKKTGVRS